MSCLSCHRQPISRICLNDQLILQKICLLCNTCCKTQQRIKKYRSQISIIQEDSYPISLFSMNSYHKQNFVQISQQIQSCRQIVNKRLVRMVNKYNKKCENMFQYLNVAENTLDEEYAEQWSGKFKNYRHEEDQIIFKQIKMLKWLIKNKQSLEDPNILNKKIKQFRVKFQNKFSRQMQKIQSYIEKLFYQIGCQDFLDNKNSQGQINGTFTKKQTQMRSSNINGYKIEMTNSNISIEQDIFVNKKKIKKQPKQRQKQKQKQKQKQEIPPLIASTQSLPLPQQKIKQKQPIRRKSKKQQKPQKKLQLSSSNQINKSSQNIQPTQNNPPLHLQHLPKKSDYLSQQKLIIDISNYRQIIYKYIQHQRTNQLISTQKYLSMFSKIKYLSIQYLPQIEISQIYIDIDQRSIKTPYNLSFIYNMIFEMKNLQQLHSNFIVSSLYELQKLDVIVFQCENKFKEIINEIVGDGWKGNSQNWKEIKMINQNQQVQDNQENSFTFQRKIDVIETNNNVAFSQNMEILDMKKFYPETKKNVKIFNWYFKQNYEEIFKKKNLVIKSQKIIHHQACWFGLTQQQIQKQRVSNKSDQKNIRQLNRFFNQLRNGWIAEFTEQNLQKFIKVVNLSSLQHLTIGYHSIQCQTIPEKFYDIGKINNVHNLYNLKSLNLINLNFYDIWISKFFQRNGKKIESLNIQFCSGLTDTFYKKLADNCPKLKKLAINNINKNINADILLKFQKVQTIILPWSDFSQIEQNKIQQNNNIMISSQYINGMSIQLQYPHIKKLSLRYINFYGCKWFYPDIFYLAEYNLLQHLNIGQCRIQDVQMLFYHLQKFINLKSLTIDKISFTNQQLFSILFTLDKLQKLSIAFCDNLDFSQNQLNEHEIRLLDRMVHLDCRHMSKHIASKYTMKFEKAKHLIIMRKFDEEKDQKNVLLKRGINCVSMMDQQ